MSGPQGAVRVFPGPWCAVARRGTLERPAPGVLALAHLHPKLLPLAALSLALGAGVAWAQNGTIRPGRGAEGPQARALEPPAAEAPPLLEARVPGDRRLAGDELDEAEVLDALAVRALRAVEQQLEAAGPSCPQLLAGRRAASMARDEAALRLQTAAALLPHDEEPRGLGDRLVALAARLESLTAFAEPLGQRLAKTCEGAQDGGPRLWLPPEARGPAQGRVVLFVDLGAPSQVLWVNGQPRAASGPGGWAVAVTPPGPISLCAAPAVQAGCRRPAEVYAAMGSAFELRPDE